MAFSCSLKKNECLLPEKILKGPTDNYYGVRRNSLSKAKFTHWLILKDITYLAEQEDDEVVERSKIIVEGQEVAVNRILKEDTNYIKAMDFSDAIGLEIGHKGNVATFDTETSKIMVDGKELQAKRVLIGGRNYIRLNDIADALGYKLSNKGNMAILASHSMPLLMPESASSAGRQ